MTKAERGATPARHRHVPRRRFSQNFLHDPAVAERIVRAVAPVPGDRVIEIGPGQGALTGLLLDAAGSLCAVEIDRDLAASLQERFRDRALEVICADATRLDLETLTTEPHALRVVGNLPYNVSTPLLFRLLGRADLVDDMHFMLQREVVERMVAAPGSRRYGRLSVMVQVDCHAEQLFEVGSGAFRPAPRVVSAVVRLRIRRTPAVSIDDRATFARTVSRLFSSRRKTLRNALKGALPAAAIDALGIDSGLRPEMLSLEQIALIANATGGA